MSCSNDVTSFLFHTDLSLFSPPVCVNVLRPALRVSRVGCLAPSQSRAWELLSIIDVSSASMYILYVLARVQLQLTFTSSSMQILSNMFLIAVTGVSFWTNHNQKRCIFKILLPYDVAIHFSHRINLLCQQKYYYFAEIVIFSNNALSFLACLLFWLFCVFEGTKGFLLTLIFIS